MLAPTVGHPRKHGENSDSTNWIGPGLRTLGMELVSMARNPMPRMLRQTTPRAGRLNVSRRRWPQRPTNGPLAATICSIPTAHLAVMKNVAGQGGTHSGKKNPKLDGCHEGQSPEPDQLAAQLGLSGPRAPGRFLSPQTPSSFLHDAGRPNPNKSSASLLQGPPSFAEMKPGKCIFRLGRSFPAESSRVSARGRGFGLGRTGSGGGRID